MKFRFGTVIKSNQEQAVASWVNYLNQIRLDQLTAELSAQRVNMAQATRTLNLTLDAVQKQIIEQNRGGTKGMHGFIAEVAECGFTNARRLFDGQSKNCVWINDNGPVDILRDGIAIQQKFSASGNHLSLQAILQHAEKYPDFLQNGGKYQIPSDHYEKIRNLLSVSKEEADKMATSTGDFSLKQWREVHEFFDRGEIKLSDIEPSKLAYKDVQAGTIEGTIKREQHELREENRERKDQAYDASKPSLKQGATVTVVSAISEGGLAFCGAIVEKRRAGKKLSDFGEEDWQEVIHKTGVGTGKGAVRGASIYALTNYTATPAAVANALVTASFGVAEQAYRYRQGLIGKDEFMMNAEIICLDTSVSALSSVLGQVMIPVPVLGAVIGNTVGSMMLQIAKDYLNGKEKREIAAYFKELQALEERLDEEYRKTYAMLNSALQKYMLILQKAFVPDVRLAFEGSVELARYMGVDEKSILKNMDEIDDYFL